jgi:D-glycero-alpha-D-manno-heptose-7-phosphate kinase
LAGGTLDIWPVYLLLERAATVNVAIDLYAEASIELAQERWRVRDEDTGREAEASSAAELAGRPGAEIAGSLLRFFAPSEPCSVTTRSLAPPRSGLGASSALGIAIASALNALTGARYTSSRLIEIVKDIEAQVLGAMTGVQDHYPGVYGGASCLWWGIGGTRREPLPLDGWTPGPSKSGSCSLIRTNHTGRGSTTGR